MVCLQDVTTCKAEAAALRLRPPSGAAGFLFLCASEIRTPVQISATCKQTIYKQTGWRGAPELSNGAGWRQRAQAMAAKQCRLRAAGEKNLAKTRPLHVLEAITSLPPRWLEED